jgi:hypothetical protein
MRRTSVEAANPPIVSVPPPDCAVRFRTEALFPLNVTTPFAFEIPFGIVE